MSRRRPSGSARATAIEILESVETRGGNSTPLLASMAPAEERERHLATSLVYGVLRQRRALDRLIERTSTRPLAAIDTCTLTAVRLAVFQILFLTRVPRASAVDETVGLVRARRGRGAAAFANGVLRAICRLLDGGLDPTSLLPDAQADPALYLAEKYSFPPFLVRRYLQRFRHPECERLLDTFNRPAPTVLRATGRCASAEGVARVLRDEGIETSPSPLLPDALRVLNGTPQHTQAFRDGLIYVQDEAAQIVPLLLMPIESHDGLLELCAAPGGKSLAAAERAPGGTRVVVSDISRSRLRLLEDNARRLRIHGLLEVVMDAAHPALRVEFGRVLLDAPCTGTGVIRRHPEIRWRRRPEDIVAMADVQERALLAAADRVRRSGRLVYSVCSLEPEEGPQRITELLRVRDDFRVVDARGLLPAPLHALVDPGGFLVTLPHRDDIDGFFAAVLRRI